MFGVPTEVKRRMGYCHETFLRPGRVVLSINQSVIVTFCPLVEEEDRAVSILVIGA